MIDIALISPNNATKTYQGLAGKFSAIEPPTWALMLAESCRKKGFNPIIIDTLAENLTDEETIFRIKETKPRFLCFVVYGQNVNSGTTNMSGAIRLAKKIKNEKQLNQLVGFIGSHVQALPKKTLDEEKCIDIVFLNEGVYSLCNLLKLKNFNVNNLKKINGIAFKFKSEILFTENEEAVSIENMSNDLPGYAWDLLPYKKKPLDLYRSPFWHANYINKFRSPYAAIQTSLGCQFKCSFCMINLINKNDNKKIGVANNYNKMRYWSVSFIENEFKKLIKLGVTTIRITDEMFLLNKKYYIPIIESLIKLNKNDKLKIWAYSRIDTVPNPTILKKIRKAGIRWLALGIESANKKIRLEIAKGKFEQVKVNEVVKQIEDADINVMANYIYGLPGDTRETIQETYSLSTRLNTLGWNTYPAMALPGSPLYFEAILNKKILPKTYEEFSFHSYETIPLENENLKGYEILSLRDKNFIKYFKRKKLKEKIENKFGKEALTNLDEMLKVKITRRLIDNEKKNI